MRKLRLLSLLAGIYIAILFVFLLVQGCAATNPNYNASQPQSASNQPYLPNAAATNAAGIAGAVAAVVPPPYGTILGVVGTLIGAIAGAFAYQKNAAATQLATSVAAQGPAVAQAVIDHASSTPQAAAVFTAVNAQLPPDPVTPPKTG